MNVEGTGAPDLLSTGRYERVWERPGSEGCGWLFYDASKNERRRWCSMEGCGNRAKARSYQARRKGGPGSGAGSSQ